MRGELFNKKKEDLRKRKTRKNVVNEGRLLNEKKED